MSGTTRGALQREHGAGAPEPGGDLVEDHQRAVLARQLGKDLHHVGGVEPHPAGTLEQRLQDDRGDLVRVRREKAAGLPLPGRHGRSSAGRRCRPAERAAKTCWGSRPVKSECIPPTGSVTRHRGEGVAVVAAADREEARAPGAGADVELQGHLHRDLDGHRARVGEEHPLQSRVGSAPRAARPARPPARGSGRRTSRGSSGSAGRGPRRRARARRSRGSRTTTTTSRRWRPVRAVRQTQRQPDARRRLHEVCRGGRRPTSTGARGGRGRRPAAVEVSHRGQPSAAGLPVHRARADQPRGSHLHLHPPTALPAEPGRLQPRRAVAGGVVRLLPRRTAAAAPRGLAGIRVPLSEGRVERLDRHLQLVEQARSSFGSRPRVVR